MSIDWEKITIKNLAVLVCNELTREHVDAVLVGGACVSIYTDQSYVSYDLDFVSHSSIKEIASILSGLGFQKESTRHFVRKD
jgi:hypothetical protein